MNRILPFLLTILIATTAAALPKTPLPLDTLSVTDAENVLDALRSKILTLRRLASNIAQEEIRALPELRPKSEFESEIDYRKRQIAAKQKSSKIRAYWGRWLAQRSEKYRAWIGYLQAQLGYFEPVEFELMNYDAERGSYQIKVALPDGDSTEIAVEIPTADARQIKQQPGSTRLSAVYYFHPTLGRTLFAVQLITPERKTFLSPVMQWKTLYDHLVMPAVYGYCPIAGSVQDMKEMAVDWIPHERVQEHLRSLAETRLKTLRLPADSPYKPYLPLENIRFQVSTNFEKETLRAVGLPKRVLDEKCTSCVSFSATFASAPYEHGYDEERKYRKNPVAKQNYAFAMARPVRNGKTPEQGAAEVDEDAEPVFQWFDPLTPNQTLDIPPVCQPASVAEELAGLKFIAATVADNTVAWNGLPDTVADMTQRLQKLGNSASGAADEARAASREIAKVASGSPLETIDGRCVVIDREKIDRAYRDIQRSEILVYHCPDCSTPESKLLKFPARTESLPKLSWRVLALNYKGRAAGLADLGYLELNGDPVDLADLYTGSTESGFLVNVATNAGCRTVLRETTIEQSRFAHLYRKINAQVAALKSERDLQSAQRVATAARRLAASGRYSEAIETVHATMRRSPAPSKQAMQVLRFTQSEIKNSLSIDNLDGVAAARLFFEPRSFDVELETRIQKNLAGLRGVGVVLDGEVVRHVPDLGEYEGGDLIHVSRKRFLIQVRNEQLQDAYPIGTKLTAYGKFNGEFEYAPGRTVPIIHVGWIETR